MAELTSCRVSTIGASMKKYTKRVRVGMAIVMNASESAMDQWMDDRKNWSQKPRVVHAFFPTNCMGVVLQILFFNQF